MTLQPSDEQQAIVQAVEQGHNLVVNAVAGSGKTTTVVFLCERVPHKKYLLMTYNARLKQETRQRASALGLGNLVVHTYHSFFVHTYPESRAYTDQRLIEFLDAPGESRDLDFDVIVIDEAQDMCPLYHRAIAFVCSQNVRRLQFAVFGDVCQSIYQYNGADSRYIELADQVFRTLAVDAPWESLCLRQTFRITSQMAAFVNECLYGGESRMVSRKTGAEKPKYVMCDSFGTRIFAEVVRTLEMGYRPDDIFVVAPSVRSRGSPCRTIANHLSRHGVRVYAPSGDNEPLDEDVLRGKIVFSSFHQVKGLERKVVIVFGFDASYFDLYKKDGTRTRCPNELYVACTRATERLVLVHDTSFGPLPFLPPVSVLGRITPRGLCTHLPSQVLYDALRLVQVQDVTGRNGSNAGGVLALSSKARQDDESYEPVSDISTLALTTHFEILKRQQSFVMDLLVEWGVEVPVKLTPWHLLRLCNLYVGRTTGYTFRTFQINQYRWISKTALKRSAARLDKLLGDPSAFRYPCQRKYRQYTIEGTIDVVSNRCGYRILYCGDVTPESILETAVTMYLDGIQLDEYCVFNVRTGQLLRVVADQQALDALVEILVRHKDTGLGEVSQTEFLETSLRTSTAFA
ncbi:hypothetical protein GGF32_002709 [Allomyces javanicus]|nr:hypothetical protein GGF32_002709 [Allomyces javanicus]